jgi:dTDP-4-dehydrorhamnose reductase
MAGHVMAAELRERGFDVISTYSHHRVPDAVYFSALDTQGYGRFFGSLQVDAVVNCIGVLVSDSTQSPLRALHANTFLPKYLEAIYRLSNTKVVHISTDCVFDGARGPYSVSDTPTETSMYGLTKALGEVDNSKDVTLRTSIIGPELATRKSSSPGLLEWILRQPEGSSVRGFSRCIWSGISTLELADAADWALRGDATGVHHVSREVGISKHDLLVLVSEVFSRGLRVTACADKEINKHLVPSEGSFPVKCDYADMLRRLQQYIEARPHLYTY